MGRRSFGFFPKKIVDWIKGKGVDVLRLVSWFGRMLTGNDQLKEI